MRQVVGSRPAIIGKTLPTKVTVGDGYVEVALDVSQSKAARYVLGVVRKFTQRVCIELAFVLEPQDESELPEQVLACLRFDRMSPQKPHAFDRDEWEVTMGGV